MLRRCKTPIFILTGIAFLSTLALHAYLGSYSRYIADDFCSAGMARRFGILRAVWYWYLNWTGRYSASALDAVFGLIGPVVTPFVPAAALLIWLMALMYAAAAFLPNEGKLRIAPSAAIAVTLVAVTLILSPNVPQSLYWGQGMRSIIPPLVLGTIYTGCLARIGTGKWPASRQVPLCILGFLLAMTIGGFNETYAALQFGALAIASAIVRAIGGSRERKELLPHFLAGTAGSALAVIVVAASPGNAIRQSFYAVPPGLVGLLQMAWSNFLQFLAHTVGAPERVLAILGTACISIFMGMQAVRVNTRAWAAPLILVGGFGLAFACFIPAAYGLSDSPPERTLLIPVHLLTLAIMLTGAVLGSALARKAGAGLARTLSESVILLLASALSIGAIIIVDQDLISSRQIYIGYAAHWDAVNAQIVQAREMSQSEIWIQPIANWAGLNEPNDNPKFWVNICLSQYYGIDVFGLDLR
jgi:hypothetical protein